MAGQLCLKWNNHAGAFNKLLTKIYLEDEYSDVTIMCQGKFYPVHRFVLSTCSEYFEEVFKHCVRLNNKHPFIIVKDTNPEQMEALLNYMYKGEVNVPQEMLPDLIKAAEAFKIKGLAVSDEDETPNRKRRTSTSSQSPSQKKSRNSDENSDTYEENTKESFDNSDSLKESKEPNEIFISEPEISLTEIKNETIETDEKGEKNVSSVKDEKFEDYDNDDAKYEEFRYDPADRNFDSLEGTSASWDESHAYDEDPENPSEIDPSQNISLSLERYRSQQCPFCSYIGLSPSHLKIHMRTHTGEKPFSCPECPFKSSRKTNLDTHIKSIHLKTKPFECVFCSYRSSRKYCLRHHMLVKHS